MAPEFVGSIGLKGGDEGDAMIEYLRYFFEGCEGILIDLMLRVTW